MKYVTDALENVLSNYQPGTLTYDVERFDILNKLWIVNVRNTEVPDSLLQVEIIDDDDVPKCSVLQKVNVGRKSMFKFMNRLVDALE